MTSFNFTSGNPSNLVGGGGASMPDLQGPLLDLKAFLNGGTLDETNVPNLSAAFTHWKGIDARGSGTATSGVVSTGGTYGLFPVAGSSANVWTAGLAAYTFYIDPADWLANSRTTKLRLRAQCVVNGAAPGTNLVPGLYPISAFGGASGSTPTIATIGTVITGSTVVFTTPALGSNTVSASSEFNAPAAGSYAFMFVAGGAFSGGSQVQLNVQLQMRQV